MTAKSLQKSELSLAVKKWLKKCSPQTRRQLRMLAPFLSFIAAAILFAKAWFAYYYILTPQPPHLTPPYSFNFIEWLDVLVLLVAASLCLVAVVPLAKRQKSGFDLLLLSVHLLVLYVFMMVITLMVQVLEFIEMYKESLGAFQISILGTIVVALSMYALYWLTRKSPNKPKRKK